MPTGLTLGEAKQWLTDNFPKHTIKKTSVMKYGEYEYHVEVREETDENFARNRNYRLYAGLDDSSQARWEQTQGPTLSAPIIPEQTFASKVEAYIKTKIDDSTIKFGFIIQSSGLTKKAICNVIMPDNTDKSILVSESPEGVFSFEILQ